MFRGVMVSKTNGLVSYPEWVWIPPFIRRVLIVPPGHCAVLTFGEGRRKVLAEGRHRLDRFIPWGWCSVRYVDAQLRRTPIPLIEALCQDGWRVGLALEVNWRVRGAAFIVDIADPVGDLITAATASVRAVIETLPHDALIGGMDDGVVNADALAQAVITKLKNNPAMRGIEILNVLITDRRGDDRRIKIVNESVLLSKQKDLECGRRDLVLLQAETERMRVEEECKARIREAEIEAEATTRLMPVKWQQVQLKLAAGTNQQRHEQALKVIEAYAQVLSEATKLGQLEAWGVSSRRRPECEVGGLEATLKQGFYDLQSVLQLTTPYPVPEHIAQLDERTALRMRIAAEVAEISNLDGVEGCCLDIEKNEQKDRVRVRLGNRKLDIFCCPGYPRVAPEVRWADNGRQKVPLEWSEGMSLKHILEIIQADVDSQL